MVETDVDRTIPRIPEEPYPARTAPAVAAARTEYRIRQQVLMLWLASSSLASNVVAWSIYDGTGPGIVLPGQDGQPPYVSALAAMVDGWNVVQISEFPVEDPTDVDSLCHLKFRVVLERKVKA